MERYSSLVLMMADNNIYTYNGVPAKSIGWDISGYPLLDRGVGRKRLNVKASTVSYRDGLDSVANLRFNRTSKVDCLLFGINWMNDSTYVGLWTDYHPRYTIKRPLHDVREGAEWGYGTSVQRVDHSVTSCVSKMRDFFSRWKW
jgi:hypothetical protein